MPISRRNLAHLGHRMSEVMSKVILAKLADRPTARVIIEPDAGDGAYDDTSGTPVAEVATDLGIGVVDRTILIDLRSTIDQVLDQCKGDKDF
jgi:hypothetical protein